MNEEKERAALKEGQRTLKTLMEKCGMTNPVDQAVYFDGMEALAEVHLLSGKNVTLKCLDAAMRFFNHRITTLESEDVEWQVKVDDRLEEITAMKTKHLVDTRNVMKNVSTEVDRINSRQDDLDSMIERMAKVVQCFKDAHDIHEQKIIKYFEDHGSRLDALEKK